MSMKEIADRIERPVKTYCGGEPHYVKETDIVERLQAKKRNATDEEDDALEEIIALRQQLAECQADNKRLRDALKPMPVWAKSIEHMSDIIDERNGGASGATETIQDYLDSIERTAHQALALPSDSTALDAMLKAAKQEGGIDVLDKAEKRLKQAKREALLEMAEIVSTLNACDAVGEYYRKAKELE